MAKFDLWKFRLADNGWCDYICPFCGRTENVDNGVIMTNNYCSNCGKRLYDDGENHKKFTILPNKIDGSDGYNTTPWIYLHGLIEDINGFDLCMVKEGLPSHKICNDSITVYEEGIYDCITIINNEEIPSKLYLWNIYRDPVHEYKGLVVMDGDKDAMEYALNCYVERRVNL